MRERTPFGRARSSRASPRLAAARHHRDGERRDRHRRRARARASRSRRAPRAAPRAPPPSLTWALILGLTRRIHEEDASIRAGGWQRTLGPELLGRTLGLIGLGHQGTRVAGYGLAFGMTRDRLEPEPRRGSRRLVARRREATELRGPARPFRRRQRAHPPEPADGRADRRPRAGADVAARLPREHLPRADRRRARAARGARGGRDRGCRTRRVRPRAAAGRPSAARRAPNTLLTPHIGYVARDSYTDLLRGGRRGRRGLARRAAPIRLLWTCAQRCSRQAVRPRAALRAQGEERGDATSGQRRSDSRTRRRNASRSRARCSSAARAAASDSCS